MYYNFQVYEEPAAILFTSATDKKDGIPPPPVRLSWVSPHPPPESVGGVRWSQNQNFSDQRVTKFAYPWCSASSALKIYLWLNSPVIVFIWAQQCSLNFRKTNQIQQKL